MSRLEDQGVNNPTSRQEHRESKKPISPLRQRMIEDTQSAAGKLVASAQPAAPAPRAATRSPPHRAA
jgi:hypothetical protein